MNSNVSAVVGDTTHLPCRVQDLGEYTVSLRFNIAMLSCASMQDNWCHISIKPRTMSWYFIFRVSDINLFAYNPWLHD